VSDDRFERLERSVRRFAEALPIDDLLPELEADSAVFLPATGRRKPNPAPAEPQGTTVNPDEDGDDPGGAGRRGK
jgi:hypothetical protein